MNEAKNEYKIEFGPYSVELKNSQVYFKKNNSLTKALPVKNTFGLYDLKKMAIKVAASVNMTNKLPVNVLKAGVNEEDESPVVTEAMDRKLAKLFQRSIKASAKDGEDKLYQLTQDWEDWNIDNDDQYDDLVDPLYAAVELVQDAGVPGTNNVEDDKEYRMYIKSADKHLKTFNRDVKKAMKLHKESVNDSYQTPEFIKESTKEWTKTIKKLAKQDQLKKISSKDKETLLKIVRLMKTANEDASGGDKVTSLGFDESLEEVIVIPGKSYKKLRYKVKDVNKFKGALVNYVKQSKLKVDLKNDGSGNFSLNGNFNPKEADKLDLVIQKTGAVLVLAESKTEKKMNESERKLRSIIREIATPLLKEEKWTIIDTRGNNVGFGMKMQANQRVKKLGGNKKGFFAIPAAASKKAKRALEKAKGNFNDAKYKETMSDLYWGESKTNEAASNFKVLLRTSKDESIGKKIRLGDKRDPGQEVWQKVDKMNWMNLKTKKKLDINKWAKHADEFHMADKDLQFEGQNFSGYTEVVSEGKSDSDMLKLALKGIKASRVGNQNGATYLKSLKNSWRLNPRDKKDYMDFTVDDWEEDVINYIQNKG